MQKSETPPLVSILCITYNQQKYVKQTIDSFLSQKTNFTFEVLVNDDASNDGTEEVLLEYQKNYPDIVKPIFHKTNQFSQGKRNMIVRYLLPHAKGKYIALCEGDDFWTDNTKLQQQVDFLDSHKDYALCFHRVEVFFENKEMPSTIYPDPESDITFDIQNLIEHNFIQTNSVMYRRQKYVDMPVDVSPGDWYLHLYHAQFGKIGFIDKVMSAYRRHAGGIWWDSIGHEDKLYEQFGLGYLGLYSWMLKIFGDNAVYKGIIDMHITGLYVILARIVAKDPTKAPLLDDAQDMYPHTRNSAFIGMYKMIADAKNTVEMQSKIIDHDEEAIQALNLKIKEDGNVYQLVLGSKWWKLRSTLLSVVNKHK